MTTARGNRPTTEPPKVGAIVDARIRPLQQGVIDRRSASVATVAQLRRAVGKPAGSVPEIWATTLAPELAVGAVGDGPTAQEIAAHAALTLYAVHQQSSSERVHQRGKRLGSAMRALHAPDAETDPVRRRFQAVGTADSLDELLYHLRGTVQLLRAAPHLIALDYGLLADELLAWQSHGRDRVRLQWGRDFYRVTPPGETPTATDDLPNP